MYVTEFFSKRCTDIKYYISKVMRGLKYTLKIKLQKKSIFDRFISFCNILMYLSFVMQRPEDDQFSGRKV